MRTTVAVAPLVFLAALAPWSCAERQLAGPPPAQSTSLPRTLEAIAAVATPSPSACPLPGAAPVAAALPPVSWREAVRLERWAEAAPLLEALPDDERGQPPLRYVRARVALALADGARALELLTGLEPALPLLAADVARYRAEAQLLAGPYAEAAAYFAKSRKAHDLCRAAEAYDRAGTPDSARLLADRAVAAAERGRQVHEEAAARLLRARLAEKRAGAAAAEADLRWLALHAPLSAEGIAAVEALDKQKHPLGPRPPLEAIQGALDTGGGTGGSPGAVAALDKLAKAPHPAPLPRGALLHAHAMALYKAREHLEAARAFEASAQQNPSTQAEDLFYAARSLARADHDEEAARRYQALRGTFRKSPYAERAGYLLGRLHLMDGRYKEAVAAYTFYLANFHKGEHREDAEYERALAQVSSAAGLHPNGEGSAPAGAASGGGAPATAGAAGSGPSAAASGAGGHGAGHGTGGAGGHGGAGATAATAVASALASRKAFAELARRAHGDEAGKLRELEGVAAFRAGDRDGAITLWTDLARAFPLSWAALTARARLVAAGAPVPPVIDPPVTHAAEPLQLHLPPASALLASLGLDADAETYLASAEREATAPYAGRESEALCELYGLLTQGKRRYRVGRWAVGDGLLSRAPSASERWAWECMYPRPYQGNVKELEDEHGLPPGFLHALMRQESGFDPAVVSPASAVGLMQLMPSTARQVCGELSVAFDPEKLTHPDTNLKLGAFYVDKLLKTFQGNVVLAAAAYNAGPRAVSHWVEAGADNDADLWVARIPYDETRNYVGRVLGNLARYQWLAGGEEAVRPLALQLPSDARAASDAY